MEKPCYLNRAVLIAAFSTVALATSAEAQVRQTVIVGRTGVTALNMPNGSSVNSATAAINDARQIAYDVNFVGNTGNPGIFLGDYSNTAMPTGGIIYNLTNVNDTLTDPGLSDTGTVAINTVIDDKLYRYTVGGGVERLDGPLGTTNYTGLQAGNDGLFAGRLGFGSERILGTFAQSTSGFPTFNQYLRQGVPIPGTSLTPTFLFTPDYARDAGVFGTKLQLDDNGTTINRLARVASDGTVDLPDIRDSAGNFIAPFNGVAISDNGRYLTGVFNDSATGEATLVVVDFAPTEGVSSISVDFFSENDNALVGEINTGFGPDVNNDGTVSFRATDAADNRSAFIYQPDFDPSLDGEIVTRLAGEGDLIMTDLGLRELGRRDGQNSMGGAPRLNDLGDVAFSLQYFDPTDVNSVADGTLLLVSATGVPEPASLGLLGLASLALLRRR